MAIRRMFSTRIVSSTRFIKMPVTSQNLYFHLGMNADDDIVESYPIIHMIKANEVDLRILIEKGYIIPFDDDVVVITDWKENNKRR